MKAARQLCGSAMWRCVPICAGVLLIVQAGHAASELSSTFDHDREDWVVVDWNTPVPGGGIAATYEANYDAGGGSPGGCVWFSDTGPDFWLFAAPGKYLGNMLDYLGAVVSLDLATSVDDGASSLLYLRSSDYMLTSWSEAVPTYFEHFEVTLDAGPDWTHMWEMEPDGTWGDFVGTPTHDDFVAVLADLVGMYVSGDHHDGGEVTNLDNFILTPEPATLALLALGGLSIMLRRRRNSR